MAPPPPLPPKTNPDFKPDEDRPESSASLPVSWSTIEEEEVIEEQEESDENELEVDLDSLESPEAAYKSFLAPYGQVLLDPDLDLEPQIIGENEEPSPDYSQVYDSYGNIIEKRRSGTPYYKATPVELAEEDEEEIDVKTAIPEQKSRSTNQDSYPSSWDHSVDMNSEKRLIANLDLEHSGDKNQEAAWSDIGQNVNSSFEFWRETEKKRKVVQAPAKLFDTKYQHNNRYASDSNINDAVDMTEPGLRKIPKDDLYTTSSSCETAKLETSQDSLEVGQEKPKTIDSQAFIESQEEHVYDTIPDETDEDVFGAGEHGKENIYEPLDVESGFFSYVAVNNVKPKSRQTVTCIPVNVQREHSRSSKSITSSSENNFEGPCHVTVNGKQFAIVPKSSGSTDYRPKSNITNKPDMTDHRVETFIALTNLHADNIIILAHGIYVFTYYGCLR